MKGERKLKILSSILALILMILPLPEWAVAYRPNWILLVIVFWIVYAADSMGITVVWFLGICLDLLSGSTLGQHPVSLMVCAFLIIQLQQSFKIYPIGQQCLVIAFLVLIYLAITRWLFGAKPVIDDWSFWMSCVTTAFLWPWAFVLLRELRRNSLASDL